LRVTHEPPEQMLKVYIDRAWLETGERHLPLGRYLFGVKEKALSTFRDEFAHNMMFDNVELVSEPVDCNFIYLPVNYVPELNEKYPNLIAKLEQNSRQFNRKVVVEAYTQDVLDPDALNFPFSNGVYLNFSLLKSLSDENFFARPYFIPDCLEKYFEGKVNLIEKEAIPSVGFCGVAAPFKTTLNKTKAMDIWRLLLTLVDDFGMDSEKVARRLGTNMKHGHRTKALLKLKYSKKVKLDAILRCEGGLVSNDYTNLDDQDSYNMDFYNNLNRNLYSLCSRGTENYSVRLYETFCMGRIPILIDTDVVLPFENEIDYERQCVVVKKSQVRNADKIVFDFNRNKSQIELENIQLNNRELWCSHFSNKAFYCQFSSILDGQFPTNHSSEKPNLI
jgi:hypothetical protein